MAEPRDDLEVAVAAARAGAASIRAQAGRVTGAVFKGEVDPVTRADRESQSQILAVLHRHRPGDAVLAEEDVEAAGPPDRFLEVNRLWIVDPLDGTVNFLHGVPHVAVSVALYEAGRAVAGVILDVFRREEFIAVAGGGAQRNGAPIRVSAQSGLGAGLVATGFAYDRRRFGPDYGAIIGEVLGRVQGLRRMGTASLDLAWVAAGLYDAFWELRLGPWDVAAGILLVEEAGGRVTDLGGVASQPGDPSVVASNGTLHDEFLDLLAAAIPPHLI